IENHGDTTLVGIRLHYLTADSASASLPLSTHRYGPEKLAEYTQRPRDSPRQRLMQLHDQGVERDHFRPGCTQCLLSRVIPFREFVHPHLMTLVFQFGSRGCCFQLTSKAVAFCCKCLASHRKLCPFLR